MNAEETLYWYHLMRSIRRPRSAGSFLNSYFFVTWIGVSVSVLVIMFGVSWIQYDTLDRQMARLYTVAAMLMLMVLSASSIIILKFPAFLKEVQAAGVNPEVRTRLHFFHEANKMRFFFRFLFICCALTLGIDGLTKERRVNTSHLAADLLEQVGFLSWFFAGIISTVVYLPRNYYNPPHQPGQVMVGGGHYTGRGGEASNALMTLLREGGQWDEGDDIRAGRTKSATNAFDGWTGNGEAPAALPELAEMPEDASSKASAWDSERGMPMPRIREIQNFTSPLMIELNQETVPHELRIHVQHEQEVAEV